MGYSINNSHKTELSVSGFEVEQNDKINYFLEIKFKFHNIVFLMGLQKKHFRYKQLILIFNVEEFITNSLLQYGIMLLESINQFFNVERLSIIIYIRFCYSMVLVNLNCKSVCI